MAALSSFSASVRTSSIASLRCCTSALALAPASAAARASASALDNAACISAVVLSPSSFVSATVMVDSATPAVRAALIAACSRVASGV